MTFRYRLFSVACHLSLAVLSFPALADDASLEQQKKNILQESRQETVALGHNRFLLFNGSKSPFQYVYGVELIKIEGGVPKLAPLFMEEYDADKKTVNISEGVGFPAMSYHFDAAGGTLDYTTRDLDADTRSAYKYKLVGDTLKLREIAVQDISQCADESCKDAPPHVIFSIEEQHAKTH